jgi:hypothetical protein
MDQNFFKQMIEMNKAAFDSTYEAAINMQDQVEKVTNSLMAQAVWMPKDGRKAMDDWATAYKQGRDEFKKTIDQNYKKAVDYFAQAK